MNSLLRATQTIKLNGTQVDRIPVDLHSFAMAAHLSSPPMDEIFINGRLMAESQINLWKELQHDVILLENGVAALAGAMGAGVEYYQDSPPEIVEPLLNDLSEVEKLEVPDVTKAGTLPELLQATRITKEIVGDNAFVMGRADQGPFSLASHLRGMERFMMDLMDPDKQELIARLLEICTETVSRFACAQIRAGADATSMGDSIAGPELISPEMYREFARDYEEEVISAVHKEGGLIALHICGDCTKILDQMVMTGADILEIDEKADFSKALKASGGRSCLLGPVSPAVLKNGEREEIIAKTREVIDKAREQANLIIGPGCALPPDTPLENIKLFLETVREYGVLN